MVASLSLFSSTYDELVYAQQHEEKNQTIDIQYEEQMNLNLGKPIYTEIFTAPKSHDKLTSSVYSFSGNGTLNGMEISSSGNGLIVREKMVLMPLLMAEHFLLLRMVTMQVILLKQ